MKNLVSTAILFGLLFVLPGHSFGVEKRGKIKTVAVMPFGAFTVGELTVDVTRLVSDALSTNGFKITAQDSLEDFLAQRRVRRPDFLDRPTIREMGTVLQVDALVMGSVDLFSDGEDPQVTMNARMINCYQSSVIWARSISLTGADFSGVLGLGKITSLKELTEIAVDQLLENVPDTVALDGSSVYPFEIIQASFSPPVLRGGEITRLSIEIREITEKVRDVRAFVLDDEIVLNTEDRRWYTGTLTAPAVEGVYELKVYVTDESNRLFSISALSSLSVQNKPPDVVLSVRQSMMSPNNDSINDYVLFFAELLKAISLDSWRIEIINEEGKVVRSDEGLGALPEGFVWRGEDNRYKTVKDGPYFCRLIVEDKAGNRTTTARQKITVDTSPPQVAVVIAEENEDAVTLSLKTDDASQIAGWELVVYNSAGEEVATFKGQKDIPPTLTYAVAKEGQKMVAEAQGGSLVYSLEVSDIAGNRLQVEKQALKRYEPERTEAEPVKEKKKWIEDF